MNGGFDPHNRLSAAAFFVSISSSTLERCVVPDIQGFGITPGRENDAIALVAQWIERPPPERKVTSPILVEGTHENSANHNARSPLLLFSLKPSRLVRVRASRGNALVAQRIERRFPKPGAAGPTPAGGTSDAGVNAATRPPSIRGWDGTMAVDGMFFGAFLHARPAPASDNRIASSVGQSTLLITGRSLVRFQRNARVPYFDGSRTQ